MSVQALGIALKLTFSGMNQLIYPQTWAFTMIVITCVVTQMNYLNKVGEFRISECFTVYKWCMSYITVRRLASYNFHSFNQQLLLVTSFITECYSKHFEEI